MKRSTTTMSVCSKISLAEAKVENYMNSRIRQIAMPYYDPFYFSDEYEHVSFCSVYAPVYGSIAISIANKAKREILTGEIMIATRFLVTCTRGREGRYQLSFGASLS